MRLGEHNKNTAPDCKVFIDGQKVCADDVQEIPVTQSDIVVHKDFNFLTVKHDIGLIRLSEPAKVHQNNIKPVCLPFSIPNVPNTMMVIGFGRTESSGTENSDVLMKVRVDKKGKDECAFPRGIRTVEIDDSQICAGGKVFQRLFKFLITMNFFIRFS